MNRTRTLAKVLVLGLLAASACATATASADEPFQSASTPEETPMVTTPSVSTPAILTPSIATPGEKVDAEVEPIELPTGVSVGLAGLVTEQVATPEATPAVEAAPEVPALEVLDAIAVEEIQVDSIPVQVQLPAAATVGTDGSHVWTESNAPTTMNAQSDDEGASIDAGPVDVEVGIDL